MINHYEVLGISRTTSTVDIKNRAKFLIKKIKNQDLKTNEKNDLLNKVYKSYEFLKDYHNRRSLDEYLESNYKIIYPEEENNKQEFTMMPFSFNFGDFDKTFTDFENNFNNLKNNKKGDSYFYSSSSYTTTNLDKDGNLVSNTEKIINDNGKKDKKEYKTVTSKKDLNKKVKKINF